MTRVSQGVLCSSWLIYISSLQAWSKWSCLQLNKIKISPQFPTKWQQPSLVRFAMIQPRAPYVLLLIMQKLSITDIVTCLRSRNIQDSYIRCLISLIRRWGQCWQAAASHGLLLRHEVPGPPATCWPRVSRDQWSARHQPPPGLQTPDAQDPGGAPCQPHQHPLHQDLLGPHGVCFGTGREGDCQQRQWLRHNLLQ